MKKIWIFLLTLLFAFTVAGCTSGGNIPNPAPTTPRVLTNQEKYEVAKNMIQVSGSAFAANALSAEDVYALELKLSAEAGFTGGIFDIGANADAKLQIKFDFNNAAASQALLEASVTYPDLKTKLEVSQSAALYYKDGKAYNSITQSYMNYAITSGMLSAIGITEGSNYMEDLIAFISGQVMGFVNSDKFPSDNLPFDLEDGFTPETLLDSVFDKGIMSVLFKQVIMEEIGDVEILPYELFNFDVSDEQIVISLNYSEIDEIITGVVDAFKAKIDGLIDNTGTFATELMADTAVAGVLKKEAFINMFQNFNEEAIVNMLEESFDDTQDTDFVNLSVALTGSEILSTLTFESAAAHLYLYKKQMAEWFIDNVGIDDFCTQCNLTSTFNSEIESRKNYVLLDMQKMAPILAAVKSCLPETLTFVVTIDFDGSLISGVGIDFDVALKLPVILFNQETPTNDLIDINAFFNFNVEIETDAADITFNFPDLSGYTEAVLK